MQRERQNRPRKTFAKAAADVEEAEEVETDDAPGTETQKEEGAELDASEAAKPITDNEAEDE